MARSGPQPRLLNFVREELTVRRFLGTFALLAVFAATFWAADKPKKDSPAAAATRKKLKRKVTVDYKDTRLRDVAVDLQNQFDNKLSIKLDNEGGVSNNITITYSATNKPLETILDEMFAKNQLGYVVVSDPKDRRDGFIIIKKGKQRGYEKSDEPSKDGSSAKDKANTDKPAKDKPAKDKDSATKDKPAKDKSTKDKGEEDPDKTEMVAAAKLSLAKMLQKAGKIDKAKDRYRDIIKMYPKTKAAEEARALLKDLGK
jgi:hypothetical protein